MKNFVQFLKKFLWYLIRPHKTFKNLKYYLIDHGAKPLAHDRQMNKALLRNEPHILFVRDTNSVKGYNAHFIDWTAERFPNIAKHIRLSRISRFPASLKKTALVVPWLQDPLKECHPVLYRRALRLQDACKNINIPVINPVETLSNSVKSRALPIIGNTGIRTAKIIKITNPSEFHPQEHNLSFPFFIREDYLHGGHDRMVNTESDLEKINWDDFAGPIAMEFINVQNDDGLYRKYRYFLMGDVGVQKHLIVSKNWRVHFRGRIDPDEAKNEELQYLNSPSDPNHNILNKARQALNFDTVAFDYSYDQNDQLVVWEPNPYPLLWSENYLDPAIAYYGPHFDTLYKNLLIYYLKKAGMNELIKSENLGT